MIFFSKKILIIPQKFFPEIAPADNNVGNSDKSYRTIYSVIKNNS